MKKQDIIIGSVIAGAYIAEIVFVGRAGALIGLINFLAGAFAMWYYLARKGVLG